MATTSSTTDIEVFEKGVSDSITSRYAKLSGTLEGSMEPFARHMFEAGLINRTTMRGQNYDNIMSQFISGMDFKHSILELKEHCRLFTDILEKLGGAAKMSLRKLVMRKIFILEHHLVYLSLV